MADLKTPLTHGQASPPASTQRGWGYPPPVRRLAAHLLNQQLWCWGRDVLCPDGNLLTRYGLHRRRDPGRPEKGATCYRSDDNACHVALWGFGVFFGMRQHGGLFIGRYSFQPRWAPVEAISLGVHSLDGLRMFGRPRGAEDWRHAHHLCRELFDWIVRYESWVQRTVGTAFRQECIRNWATPIVSAAGQVKAWRRIRDRSWTSASEIEFFSNLLRASRETRKRAA